MLNVHHSFPGLPEKMENKTSQTNLAVIDKERREMNTA